MPGRYCCTHQREGGRLHRTSHAGREPAGAAAYAMRVALDSEGPYTIFAPQRVLEQIPENLRSRT